MSTTQQARTTEEGGAVDLERYEWAYLGEAPDTPEEAGYQAYEEPAAETDNDWNHGDQVNDELLNWKMGGLESEIDQLRQDLQDLRDDFNAHNHDSRYYRKTETEDRYVNETGDTMTGRLSIDINESGYGMHFDTSADDEPHIIPWDGGGSKRYDRAIEFGNGEWDIEGSPKAGGQTIATQLWANENLVNESGDTMTGPLVMEAPIAMRSQADGASTSRAITFENDQSGHNVAIESAQDTFTVRSSQLGPGVSHFDVNPITGHVTIGGSVTFTNSASSSNYLQVPRGSGAPSDAPALFQNDNGDLIFERTEGNFDNLSAGAG